MSQTLTPDALPFAQPGRFFKGNLHTHSTRSDGNLTPDEVIAAYRERGYDFLVLTDHFLPEAYFRKEAPADSFITISDTTGLRSDEFTTILGAEIHGPGMGNGELWHLVAVGLPLDFPDWTPGERGEDLARRAVEAGAFVAIAHPHWNSLTLEDALRVAPFVHSVEIYNHACNAGIDRGDGLYLLDQLMEAGYFLSANAADDAHFKTPLTAPGEAHPEAFGGWVMVKAESLDPDALVAALKAGHYYASTGPEIASIAIDEAADELVVETSPVQRILATGNGPLSRRAVTVAGDLGEGITSARFELEPFRKHGFVRVTAIDAEGKRAWSSPIHLAPVAAAVEGAGTEAGDLVTA
ncbi:MAG TPA: CehA/McbA family metallohydrolase [Thermomicrobiales bacterium]|nr:CehA/McbA family metallohydrolase [Thermomicrobiales bacterium]